MTSSAVAARERELRANELKSEIERVSAAERALVSAHARSFPRATPTQLPPPEPVEPAPMRVELEASAGIPALEASTGGGETPPIAAQPEPVDRYELMREHRKRRRAGIPVWRLRDRIEAARAADREAEQAAAEEAERRADGQRREQERLDELWAQLCQAREKVSDELPSAMAAERKRRETERNSKQAELDDDWRRLQDNEPGVAIRALERAFAGDTPRAVPIACEGKLTTLVVRFPGPEAVVPERKPARTPTGKPTLKKRTKTESNSLYLQALGSNVLAIVKKAFAAAPGTETVQVLVVRHESEGRRAGRLAPIYAGEFGRSGYEAASGGRDPVKALTLADGAILELKGQTAAVAPIDLSGRPDLEAALAQAGA